MKELYKKLLAVRKAVGVVPKGGTNNYHGYSYSSSSDVLDTIKKHLDDQGLITWFTVSKVEQQADITVVTMLYRIIDADTEQSLETEIVGYGKDSGDKGIFKAYTGAEKYYLLKMFLMSTDNADPENDKADKHPVKTIFEHSKPISITPVTLTPSQTEGVDELFPGSQYPTWEWMLTVEPNFPKVNKQGVQSMVYRKDGISKKQLTWLHTEIKKMGSSTLWVQENICVKKGLPVDLTQLTWKEFDLLKKELGLA